MSLVSTLTRNLLWSEVRLGMAALALAAASAAAAQSPSPAAPSAPPDAAQKPSAAAKPPAPGNAQAEAGEPRADTSGAPKGARSTAAKPSANPVAKGGPVKTDRLDLGLATVTGDHEQPKVLYIVPWKKSDIGDLQGKPMNSLVDEILSPVDRDVFRREVVYYKAVQADTSQNGANPAPASKVEK